MTKLEGNLTPNVRFNAKGDNSLLVFRWGSQVVLMSEGLDVRYDVFYEIAVLT